MRVGALSKVSVSPQFWIVTGYRVSACAAPSDAAVPGDAPVWGVAAPSANRFGRVSPTTAQHVQDELGEALLVLDGGPCQVGIESTIVDCTRGVPVLLRPGALMQQDLAAFTLPVLVVHHAKDACPLCRPADVPYLLRGLRNAPVKKLLMLDGGSEPQGAATITINCNAGVFSATSVWQAAPPVIVPVGSPALYGLIGMLLVGFAGIALRRR